MSPPPIESPPPETAEVDCAACDEKLDGNVGVGVASAVSDERTPRVVVLPGAAGGALCADCEKNPDGSVAAVGFASEAVCVVVGSKLKEVGV
jgi:hypothetical protein